MQQYFFFLFHFWGKKLGLEPVFFLPFAVQTFFTAPFIGKNSLHNYQGRLE